jgi:hypothetical protein
MRVQSTAMPASDTSPAAHARQLELYRRVGPERRAEIAAELSEAIREISREGVRSRHPELSEEEITRELLRIFYGRKGTGSR